MPTYYAQRKSILNGEPQTINNRFGDRRSMERQYALYRASACDGTEFQFDVDSIEWGTVEQGVLERIVYKKTVEPEPES